ncbi:hypothetical protein A2U01_0102345, partial [Trifolium medium]|nr:hypothetical protein [Trifolium medium]
VAEWRLGVADMASGNQSYAWAWKSLLPGRDKAEVNHAD